MKLRNTRSQNLFEVISQNFVQTVKQKVVNLFYLIFTQCLTEHHFVALLFELFECFNREMYCLQSEMAAWNKAKKQQTNSKKMQCRIVKCLLFFCLLLTTTNSQMNPVFQKTKIILFCFAFFNVYTRGYNQQNPISSKKLM